MGRTTRSLTSGEFASLTSLSAKALRLYDERGVLTPADVDAWSGRRCYDSSQLHHGLLLGVLRMTGTSLADLPRSGAGSAGLRDLRARLEAERLVQDFYLDLAERVAAYDPAATTLEEHHAGPQPWTAVAVDLPPLDDDPQQLVAAVGDLGTRVRRARAELCGALDGLGVLAGTAGWTTMPEQLSDSRAMLVAVPTTRRPGDEELRRALDGHATASGTLPERLELPLGSNDGTDGPDDPDGVIVEAARGLEPVGRGPPQVGEEGATRAVLDVRRPVHG